LNFDDGLNHSFTTQTTIHIIYLCPTCMYCFRFVSFFYVNLYMYMMLMLLPLWCWLHSP